MSFELKGSVIGNILKFLGKREKNFSYNFNSLVKKNFVKKNFTNYWLERF